MSSYRTFESPGRGGLGINPETTCLLGIEFQNEFATEGGKLHAKVKPNMQSTGMLANTSNLCIQLRKLGVKIFHAPISFAPDSSDNPNRHLGILAGCDYNKLFVRGTWNVEICKQMTPVEGDILIVGKHGLSAFPNTTLEEELKKHQIETIVLAGFMANCCVESTMRDACERGYNVVTLTDCVATTSIKGWHACTEITYPFFSTTMQSDTFLANIRASVANTQADVSNRPAAESSSSSSSPSSSPYPRATWSCQQVGEDQNVYHVGPWFVDVRLSTVGEKLTLRSGAHELRRYLTFAEASGMFVDEKNDDSCAHCSLLSETIYSKMLPKYAALEAKNTATAAADEDDAAVADNGGGDQQFGWLCNMSVVRLKEGGCVLYSPILDANGVIDGVVHALEERDLLPIKIIIAPSPQHHLSLSTYQETFPQAVYFCGKASPQMTPLTKKRRDLRFDGVISATENGMAKLEKPSVIGGVEGADGVISTTQPTWEMVCKSWDELREVCKVSVLDDRRTGEVVMLHVSSKTLIVSDLLYKSAPEVVGPGGTKNHYSLPRWFAEGQQELFYGKSNDNSGGLLPAYRTHPRMRTIDLSGMKASLDHLLNWEFDHALACHTDKMSGAECRALIRTAWGWVWQEMETGQGR
jgi:nicotinamidase-related amidase